MKEIFIEFCGVRTNEVIATGPKSDERGPKAHEAGRESHEKGQKLTKSVIIPHKNCFNPHHKIQISV